MAAHARVLAAAETQGDAPWADTRPRRPAPGLATGQEAPAASPALMLQHALSAELGRDQDEKWSPATTLMFVLGTCGTFWALVGFGVSQLIH